MSAAVAPLLDPVIAGYAAGQPLLHIPGEMVGSFHVRGGFYRSAQVPGKGLVTLSAIRLRTEVGEVDVKDVVWLQNLGQPDERGITVLLDAAWLREEGGCSDGAQPPLLPAAGGHRQGRAGPQALHGPVAA
ncbi:hypothetical protein QOL99_10335 [Deinococcus sp. MIMF12]|uniref:Uncharacterized protein n=1 Tax=Deinococcus rhizophilus TaxID=3049544 RepID=A0ABT7JJC2_9DEIO|nr:hypothetical protein [Deinococcus rhizophilus]MDL2344553.1 hypothetical protein [Deinococcus rhizophilus]